MTNTPRKIVFDKLEMLNISFEVFEHPPLDTIEIALKYWKNINAFHCKNLFFRNHKGEKHYLVIIKDTTTFNIRSLEQRLKQGKLSFASEKRLLKYLGVRPGSVSAFGLINDDTNHVHVFMDNQLQKAKKISFHPNDNTASVVLEYSDFIKYLNSSGNTYEYIDPSPKND
ncbi:MAG: prolyl-tRNA editing protein [Lentimicrobiaceae bacterium]|jgi:Ala-tRNA(Pro) deacylase|nr:prolyl-tRNA editing protein [Lentimicrobiaceae bacterium]MDG1901206.1 prolyl-tRNA synthetase associated domain-containing protein [Bacteroidales bacterium]MDG2080337.1 prolyl-tRNA synthetase associated domain-containing protein [Bacteroidales bacterium]|tara:strand:+ start:1577 stop:2086 length:510 start_codon:yes stop_codon:yes gene_type:complete